MPRLTVTIHVNNEPLKRIYVEHIASLGFISIPIGLYMTDNQGKFSFNSQTHDADIRILGQNSVARVIEGGGALFVADIWVDKKVDDGTVVKLDTREEKVEQFKILNRALGYYDNVHRSFAPFKRALNPDFPDPDFPLGGERRQLQRSKDSPRRIEIVYPDNLPQELAFVEPKSIRTGYPLVHLKAPGQGRGDGSAPLDEELAHALHFAKLSDDTRGDVEINYARYLLGRLVLDGNVWHGFNVRTNPMVAYIEAFGLFIRRFTRFQASQREQGADLHSAFVRAELQRADAGRVVMSATPIKPAVLNDDIEGAVYGAIFVHFASLTSLDVAVQAFYASGAITFDQYHDWVVQMMSAHADSIRLVKNTWGM